jgi:hypothetical protein
MNNFFNILYNVLLSSNISLYLPSLENKYEGIPAQGWNKYRIKFLSSLGYDKEDIEAFDHLINRHVQGINVDDKMMNFVRTNRELVIDSSKFELESIKHRSLFSIKYAEDKILNIKESIDYYNEHKEDPNYSFSEDSLRLLTEDLNDYNTDLSKNKELLAINDIKVIRKGTLDRIILSFARGNTIILNKGTDRETYLEPDNNYTVNSLVDINILPVAGIGAYFNMYAEKEITFINLNSIS